MLENPANLELIFKVANLTAMLGWVILILLPRRWKPLNYFSTLVIPVLLSFVYSVLILISLSGDSEGGFSSLAEVKLLFTSDKALLAGWIHYLAFDLFIGGVIARKSDVIGLHRIIQAPILFLTFMLGPLGFVLFQLTYGGWSVYKSRQVH